MKKILAIFLLLTTTILAHSQQPKGYFHYAPFMDIEQNTYLETYLAIAGNSVTYRPTKDGKEQASVEVTMVFKNGEIVKGYRKFNLKSAEIESTKNQKSSFINLERFALENGTYNFELKLKDNYADSAQYNFKDIITIDIDKDSMGFSGITLAENIKPTDKRNKYSKSGFDIVPYVSNFYPDAVNELSFYLELYNLDQEIGRDSTFFVKTFLEGNPTSRLYAEFTTINRKKAAPINVVMKSFDISTLNSGNYNLVVQIRDTDNQLIGEKKKFIQRSNKEYHELKVDYTNIDISKTFSQKIKNFGKLKDYIYALYPIANRMEQKFILQDFKPGKLKLMQQFFYNFWKERNPSNPEEEWNIYKKQLRIVQKNFGYGRRRGYATDLGRIYLKYGPPSSIREDHLGHQQIISAGSQDNTMVDAVDYQIWHYYKINDQTDRIFVFVKGLDKFTLGTEYVLLYTDVAGELSYDDGLNFTSVSNLVKDIDSQMLRDIQSESARALTRFLSGQK